jgi:hypothetical protein
MARLLMDIEFCASCCAILWASKHLVTTDLVLRGGGLPVKMAHEIFKRCVVRVWQVINALVKPDVPQTVIVDFCPYPTVTPDNSERVTNGNSLAASKKP